ncbi:MAG: serine/threonine-protein phosphatase [Ruminococcaceae bacterium]|nr:serine/threonine-protein phosphatase [Oscillospiraceae bacterium]
MRNYGIDMTDVKHIKKEMIVSYSNLSEKGGREINEDAVKVTEVDGNFCFIVCDGLGGHGKGEIASAETTEKISECFESDSKASDFFDTAFKKAQENLLEKQKEIADTSQMKTTAVVLTITDGYAQWCHIGDSRLYFFSKAKIKERTTDHSLVQMLAIAGDIKEKEIRFHPERNVLLKVMGSEWEGNSYVVSEKIKVKKGDSFLLCTDGFWEFINEKEMKKYCKKSLTAEDWLQKMKDEVETNSKGKDSDNYSAITVKI